MHQTIKLFPSAGTAPTPEFLAAFVDLLCGYPESVVAEALNPKTGLPVQYQYLPALSQIKQALDIATEARGRVLAREARVRAQIEERASLEAPRATRPTYEELVATLPESLRLKKDRRPAPLTEAEFLAKFPHVTKEQLDACPNADTGPFAKLSASNPEPNPFEAPQ